MEVVQEHWENFVEKLKEIKQLDIIEEKTQVPREYIVSGVAGFMILMLLFGYGSGLFCNLFGFGYACYMSFKAIESPGTDDDEQWLIYWVIFAFFNTIEIFSDVILAWFPFYYALKLGFIIALIMPRLNLARILYENSVRKFLVKSQDKIDGARKKASDFAAKSMMEVGANALKKNL